MMDNKNLNQSIIKAFILLDAFTNDKKEWGVRELAYKTGYNKSTVHRLLSTLVSLNVIHQNENEKYRLGSKLFELGNRVSLYQSLITITNQPIKNVALEIQETVLLGTLKDHQVFYINKADSLQGLKISTSIGSYQPIHATASGKLLLAFSSSEKQDDYFKNNTLNSFTQNTITKKTELKNSLQTIQNQKYALDLEEFELGLICIAIPIFNKKGNIIASLSASGPSSRFRIDNVQNYITILQKGASIIENSLQDFDSL
ncbi:MULTISPECIES: IclR family transcriptional regulator [unclassified Tenacibaculum]|uniref:IclR family transcriptional regulator n=1 Tax=unclassified Tenacibaculum TaxID=2635139 RepID=UPI001F1F4990|nr:MULTISPECIES: IclR family transcriptional regulator [unclassified Tenacibaculum]MCF2876224.1 IclR family transcriptional regulator [Tenacibaculum sp. Cn5-1]MCF2936299.1 IclR family transcriptional regulator [Tenacibaculum sp. Cn5-34]MCG7511642.1 IclR family transcriptional regulator [Tenacibaculum sp. Cn5-46]